MSGKCRPSLRAKTLENVQRCNLSETDKDCIKAVFELMEKQKAEIESLKKESECFADIGKMYSEIKAEVRAEAVKEFADLAIKTICEKVNALPPIESYIVEKCNEVIYSLKIEMVGEG